jgi:hypothetical protein
LRSLFINVTENFILFDTNNFLSFFFYKTRGI